MSTESHIQKLSLTDQLALLALPQEDGQLAQFSERERDRFKRSIREFKHQDRTQAFVAYIFRQLGLPSNDDLAARVNHATSRVEPMDITVQARVGEAIPSGSPIKLALTGLD